MSGEAASLVRSRRLFAPATHVKVLLVGYGVLVALLGAAYWGSRLPAASMGLEVFRQTQLAQTEQVFDAGGPPLVAATVPYRQALKEPSRFFPASQSDDPGIYLYLPVLGRVTGDANPLSQLKWFFIGCMALVLLAYPLVFYLLFDSIAIAVVAPLAVLVGFHSIEQRDIYVIQAWAILFGLPLVLLASTRPWRRKWGIGLLALAALSASFANSVRAHAGTGVVLVALAVLLLRERGWRWRAGGAAILIAAYVAIVPLGFKAITTYSYHHVNMPTSHTIAGHPFWHPMYLGLGYLQNRWGILWNDQVAINTAQRVDPHVGYLTAGYERILRHQYVQIVEHDPGYVLRVYATKAAVVLSKMARTFWLPLLLLPFVAAFGRRRATFRRALLLTLPAFVLALLPPVLTEPQNFDTGVIGAIAWLSLLAFAGAFLLVRDWFDEHELDLHALFAEIPAQETLVPVRAAIERRVREPRLLLGRPLVVAGALAALVAVGAGAVAAAASSETEVWYQRHASLLADSVPAGRPIRSWSGPSALAKLHQTGAAVLKPSGSNLEIVTSVPKDDLELASPSFGLTPGTYALVAAGAPLHGGLALGMKLENRNLWVGVSYYWAGQPDYATKRMVATFTVAEPTTARVAVTNWAPNDASSTWLLRSLVLEKLPTGG